MADLTIINKTDLVNEEELTRTREAVRLAPHNAHHFPSFGHHLVGHRGSGAAKWLDYYYYYSFCKVGLKLIILLIYNKKYSH